MKRAILLGMAVVAVKTNDLTARMEAKVLKQLHLNQWVF